MDDSVLDCAYCDRPCVPTREHVIPDWYNDTPGEAETFSARAPITHLQGDIVIRDVCRSCNNGILASLDEYGKQLYRRYFSVSVYDDERVSFDYDGNRLLRWLLKLSYNSARAQNADTGVLREYRKAVLGQAALSDHLRCWLHLTPAAYLEPFQEARTAQREEAGRSEVVEPIWFRIVQFRLSFNPATVFVQRQVIINSFSFTLLLAPLDSDRPNDEFERLAELFAKSYPKAQPILPGNGYLIASADGGHAADTLYPTLCHYPTRFGADPNPYITSVLNGDINEIFLYIEREQVEAGDIAPFAAYLHELVAIRENALGFKLRVGAQVTGYDDDPRELWQIPEARQFFCRLFLECPFVMLLANPRQALLKLCFACWLHEDLTQDGDFKQERVSEFFNRAFRALNELTYRLAISVEINREISEAAKLSLLHTSPDPDT